MHPERIAPLAAPGIEPIRLVIWDLDETFWHGTLTEGGVRFRPGARETVIELARRGIISSICSKNNLARVRDVLEQQGLWDYFVFPSVDWTPKGPRLAALVNAVQLRPPSILFIDDNALNRAEAVHFAPGIQVASDALVDGLLQHPLLAGKNDYGLTRLAQYQQLQRRQAVLQATGDADEFLRQSDITVTIEHDLEPHIDRVVELINRTNQLNFTKRRLPEELNAARAAVRELISPHTVQAGILRVRDRHGDYGYCGFYALYRAPLSTPRLQHFCFSCRILNMGVETWLYQQLGRPMLSVRGAVASDVRADTREIKWIRLGSPGNGPAKADARLDYVLARGACDINPLAHYFSMTATHVETELNVQRDGKPVFIPHSIMARHAIAGISEQAREAARPFGYRDEDFTSAIAKAPAGRNAAWVLSFNADNFVPLYRYRPTGELLPLRPANIKARHGRKARARGDDAAGGLLHHLTENYDRAGLIPDELFMENVRLILDRVAPSARAFIILVGEFDRSPDGTVRRMAKRVRRNSLILEVASGYPNVELIPISQFADPGAAVVSSNHYDRIVYFRIYRYVMTRIREAA